MFHRDELDERLIAELQEDACRSNLELGRRLGTSKTTVRRRMKRLMDEGVIKMTCAINVKKIGLLTPALIGLDVDLSQMDSVIEQLVAMQPVNLVAVVTGRYDVVVGLRFASTQELTSFLRKEIANIDGIRDIETLIELEIRKQTPEFA